MSDTSVKIAIIGGTGVEKELDILTDVRKAPVAETPYGYPSDPFVVEGKIDETPIVILSRHGQSHHVSPSNVNYRANLWTLKKLGCTHVIVTTACGSLQEKIKPGTIGILDQYVDRTAGKRENTFYQVCHIPQGKPFDAKLQQILVESCKELNYEHHPQLTAVTIEGPRFSTLAESRLYRTWNCDIVNMTTVPEAQLAAELGLVYGALALVTDYDCWHCDEAESVTVELVTQRMADLKKKASQVLIKAARKCSALDWSQILVQKRQLAAGGLMKE